MISEHLGRRICRAVWAAIMAAALATGAHRPLAAQGFRALVRDSSTGKPLEGALLRILDSTGATLAQRYTDQAGLVTGKIFDDATVYFAVTSIGYRPFLSQPVAVGPETPVTLRFTLVSRALALPDLVVRAHYAPALRKTGFTDREREGFGHFIGPEAIEQRRLTASSFLDYLVNIPGVSIYSAGSGRVLRFSGMGSVLQACSSPRIYVDGFAMDASSLETIIQPDDVLAMEVYRRPVEVPPEFGGSNAGCGVLLIWSRRGLP